MRATALFLGAVVLTGSAGVGGCSSAPPVPPTAPEPVITPPPPPPPATPPPPPVAPQRGKRKPTTSFEVTGNVLKVPGPVAFEGRGDKLGPASDDVLFVAYDYLVAHPEVGVLRIEGHTDSEGRADANQALSEKRAMAVARWLVGQGIDCRRVFPVGFGMDHPAVPNDTPDNRASNRRIAFVNAKVDGKTVGALLDGGGKPAGDPCR